MIVDPCPQPKKLCCSESMKRVLCMMIMHHCHKWLRGVHILETVYAPSPTRMHLHLSHYSPLHASFAYADGQVMYEVKTPFKFSMTQTSKINRVVPNDITKNPEDMHDKFEEIGSVGYKPFRSSSVLRFGETEFETKEYFRGEEGNKERYPKCVFMRNKSVRESGANREYA